MDAYDFSKELTTHIWNLSLNYILRLICIINKIHSFLNQGKLWSSSYLSSAQETVSIKFHCILSFLFYLLQKQSVVWNFDKGMWRVAVITVIYWCFLIPHFQIAWLDLTLPSLWSWTSNHVTCFGQGNVGRNAACCFSVEVFKSRCMVHMSPFPCSGDWQHSRWWRLHHAGALSEDRMELSSPTTWEYHVGESEIKLCYFPPLTILFVTGE